MKTRLVSLALGIALVSIALAGDQKTWRNPLRKSGYLNSPLVEATPFVFNGRLYVLENWQAFFDVPGAQPGTHNGDDVVRIRDVATDKIVATPFRAHGFGTAFVWKGRVYVFASKWPRENPRREATSVSMTSSVDLTTWAKPVTVIEAERGETIFNTAVCRGPDGFILLYETNDSRWPPFTFKYCESDDLTTWTRLPNALYGTDKYVGGPALYREGDFFYTLYLQDLGEKWETRITRSTDLVHWQNAPLDRPFVTFDPTHKHLPLRPSDITERNASDAELCYWKGKTLVYFTGGDQQFAGDLQSAEYDGTPQQLLESFFADVPAP